MSDQFCQRLQQFAGTELGQSLGQLQRGIEKESLRISPTGYLAQTPHPAGLGSALTHPSITTDFSEALLELITPVNSDLDTTLQQLDDVHRFVYSQLEQESLWAASMPCALAADQDIPLAQYGSSNVAEMKTAYRRGLGHRYGRAMQTIAGIHYNFSLPDNVWPLLQQADNDQQALQDYITQRYFALIRNFHRISWLLLYLFGASPAVCSSFLGDRPHQLQNLQQGTLYLPYATALRMGNLGYQSNAQQNLSICYNSLDNYLHTLRQAIIEPHADYQAIGVEVDGEYQQLSTALLQIENEFYSTIRPKRVARSNETALGALKQGGVEYIEVRCTDVNPFLPLGIDATQIRFLDCFLIYCLLADSPRCDEADRQRISHNLTEVVNQGRRPGLQLQHQDGEIGLVEWGEQLLRDIHQVAVVLDQVHGGNDYQQACQQQQAKLLDASLTPSARILHELQQGQSFFDFAMQQSKQHQQYFASRPLTAEQTQQFKQQSELSLQQQAELETVTEVDFEQYLKQYFQQYHEL